MIERFKNIKSKLGRWFWVIVVLVVILAGRYLVNRNKAVEVETEIVGRGNIVQSVSTSGRVDADQYSNLTFATAGRVSFLNVKAGDRVVKGRAMAGLDTIVLNASYQQAQNNYRNYQAAAESALDSVKNHSGDETFAQKATRTAAEVARDNAYDAMIAAQENLRNAIIYAPFTGFVSDINNISPGVNSSLTSSSIVFVNPETTYFSAEVDETDLSKVKVGQKVNIKLDAYPDEDFTGVVETIGLVAITSSTGGNAYSVRITMPVNTDLRFKVGMQGDIDIVYETIADTIKIPSTAIVGEGDKLYVWKIVGGRLNRTEVEVGGESSDESEIRSGINEGDVVASEPQTSFKENQKVKL